jgi:hypothetical protein
MIRNRKRVENFLFFEMRKCWKQEVLNTEDESFSIFFLVLEEILGWDFGRWGRSACRLDGMNLIVVENNNLFEKILR